MCRKRREIRNSRDGGGGKRKEFIWAVVWTEGGSSRENQSKRGCSDFYKRWEQDLNYD